MIVTTQWVQTKWRCRTWNTGCRDTGCILRSSSLRFVRLIHHRQHCRRHHGRYHIYAPLLAVSRSPLRPEDAPRRNAAAATQNLHPAPRTLRDKPDTGCHPLADHLEKTSAGTQHRRSGNMAVAWDVIESPDRLDTVSSHWWFAWEVKHQRVKLASLPQPSV